MILDEFASLRASGRLAGEDPLAQAVHNVAAEQFAHLAEENYEYIADGWLETIREWTRLDWMLKAGRERPPWLVTRLTALDGRQDEPGGRNAVVGWPPGTPR
jgi:hypothetical protein